MENWEFLLKENTNPPCNTSVATSCVESAMASPFDEGKVADPVTEGESSSAEREMAIDENASTVSLAPNLRVRSRSFCGRARRRGMCPRLCGSSEW